MNVNLNISPLLPGLLLSIFVSLVAWLGQELQFQQFGHSMLDAVVIAILAGMVLRTIFSLPGRVRPGLAFASKTVLELAIVLLGGSFTLQSLAVIGPGLLAIVCGIVILGLLASYGIGRALGLSNRLAVLIACGNAICGNSAIVAAAPVVKASEDEVAAAIAFTAALGIVVVLVLPAIGNLLALAEPQYGVLVGLTVYAVPQVLAASLPMGLVSLHIGTLTKLVRVLMLGPVLLALSLIAGRKARLRGGQMLPWFVIGFVAMISINSLGWMPTQLSLFCQQTSMVFTILSMAALGLSVDMRTMLGSGGRILAVGSLSILLLGLFSLVAVSMLPTLSL